MKNLTVSANFIMKTVLWLSENSKMAQLLASTMLFRLTDHISAAQQSTKIKSKGQFPMLMVLYSKVTSLMAFSKDSVQKRP